LTRHSPIIAPIGDQRQAPLTERLHLNVRSRCILVIARHPGRTHRPVRVAHDEASKSWNSSHLSRGPDGGCSQADLRGTAGDGLFYCFAAN